MAPSFTTQQERATVYKIYQLYEAMKRSTGDMDLVDRVVRLIAAIRNNKHLERILGKAFHEVYIDAGDTAQAISQDSTFRFNDPKGLFYEHFSAASDAISQCDLARPKLFTLNKNYRSHQGILAVASLIMDLLWKVNCDAKTFVSGKEEDIEFSKRSVEFGAEQVILVRDEAMKNVLKEQLREAALILTILEAKGMEFDDVVLWNFFHGETRATVARKLASLYVEEQSTFDAKKNWAKLVLGAEDSVDPQKWSMKGQQLMQLGNYKDAAICFKKAGNKQAETIALARMQEGEARRSGASGDMKGSKAHLEAAIGHFSHVGLFEDASRCLIKIPDYGRAAFMWLKQRKLDEAAPLFLKANFHTRAATCFRIVGMHDDAAAALQSGSHYHMLVPYIKRNRDQFSPEYLRSFAPLCKLLLKRKKLDSNYRKDAIALLGTADEQEAVFLEYGMGEDLANLYAEQGRHKELYDILLQMGLLERALITALTCNSRASDAIIPETIIGRLLDYVCVGHFYRRRKDATLIGLLSAELLLVPASLSEAVEFGELPLEMVEEAIAFTKLVVLKGDASTWALVLLAAGVWTINGDNKLPAVLDWSPLRDMLNSVEQNKIVENIRRWVLEQLSSMIMNFQAAAKRLFTTRWPFHCVQFLTAGSCSREGYGEDILRLNNIFCNLSILHSRKLLSETFQSAFMPARRYWLETLFKELTWVSSFEQDSTLLRQTILDLMVSGKYPAIRSGLENLLYHRLDKDWDQNSGYSALLEQLQLAKIFGRDIHVRFSRTLFFKLGSRSRLQQHLRRLDVLCYEAEGKKPAELILKIRATAFVLPQAWINLYIPRIPTSALDTEASSWQEKYIYREMLVEVIQSFARLMSRLDGVMLFRFQVHGKPSPTPLLQKRNIDLLLIALANSDPSIKDFNRVYMAVREILGYRSVRLPHLRFKAIDELRNNLALAFKLYDGKDTLVVVSHGTQHSAFENLSRQNGVLKATFDDIRVCLRRCVEADHVPHRNNAIAARVNTDEEHPKEEIAAIILLQRWWRLLTPQIPVRRLWLQTPEAQVVARFLKLGAHLPLTFSIPHPVRRALTVSGVSAQLRLAEIRQTYDDQYRKAMSMLEEMDASGKQYEALDDVLRDLCGYHQKLKIMEGHMSDQNIRKELHLRPENGVRMLFSLVSTTLEEIGLGLAHISEVIASLAKGKAVPLKPALGAVDPVRDETPGK
ncbi:MAG: hypothetical protein Q9163_003596 [Psora crenata]